MKKVVAQSKEHRDLIKDGWKPHSAFQVFEHKVLEKNGYFTGHDLKEKSKLYVVMEKNDDRQ